MNCFRTMLLSFLAPVVAMCGAFSGSVNIGMRYDSNICRLSDYDILRFSNGEKDFLIGTSDDAAIRPGGSIRWKAINGKIKVEFSLSMVMAAFIRNSDKNYIWTSGYCVFRKGKTRMKMSATFVPRLRGRAYIDDDTDSTKWAGCWIATGSIEIKHRAFLGIYLGGQYEYRRAQYNDYFPEYDSDRQGFGLFAQKFKPVKVSAGYVFYRSIARGYDQMGETKETSDETDISYEQDFFYISLGRNTTLCGRSFRLNFEINASHRVYISEKPYSIDPLHLGRDEWQWSLKPELKCYISENLWAKLDFEYSVRRARSAYNPDIPKLRNYDRSRSTITIGWDF